MEHQKPVVRITKITHYSENDDDCDGDYHDVELLDDTGNVIAHFGDYYHDKGDVKADSFIEGIEYALNCRVELTEKDVNDR